MNRGRHRSGTFESISTGCSILIFNISPSPGGEGAGAALRLSKWGEVAEDKIKLHHL